MRLNTTLTLLLSVATLALSATQPQLEPNYTSSASVEIFNPGSLPPPSGPWSHMARAGPTLYIAGQRGIHASNDTLAETGYPRIRLAFENMLKLAKLAGAERTDCVRLVEYVSDMFRYRPIANLVQQELWDPYLNGTGNGSLPYPPRTIVEVQRLNDDDIFEVEGTFWLG